jgi:hypothetical protein
MQRIFGLKRDEVMVVVENCIMESFRTFNASPDVIRMMKSRRMKYAGHIACM